MLVKLPEGVTGGEPKNPLSTFAEFFFYISLWGRNGIVRREGFPLQEMRTGRQNIRKKRKDRVGGDQVSDLNRKVDADLFLSG